MEIGKTRLALSASMLALALALAGCGGGGSGSTTTAPPTGPTGSGSNAGNDTGNNAGNDTDDDMAPTLTATQQAVVDAKAVVDGLAADATRSVRQMAHRNYLMAAYDEMMAADDAVKMSEADDDATAEERGTALVRQADAKMAYAAAWELGENKRDRDAAKLRAMAIGPGGMPLTSDVNGMNVEFKVDGTNPAFTFNGGTLAEVTMPAKKFAISTTYPNARDLGDKFSGGHVWTRSFGEYGENGYNGEWIIPHTDKAADKGAKFSEWYADNAPTGSVAGFNWKTRDNAIGVASGVITIGSGANADTLKLFDFDFTMDEDDGADDMKFTGSFHGIPGELTCTGTCTVPTFDPMGDVANITNDWTFTPTAKGDELAKLDVADVQADAEYLDFGVWGTFAEVDQDNESREYGVFAKASVQGDTLTSLSGTAEYKGMASGTYAKKMKGPDGMSVPASHGGFTATAELMAQFGTSDDVAENDQNTISGTITDFRDRGSLIDESWTVMLERAKFVDNGVIGGNTPGVTKAAGSMTPGEWTGAFLGGDGSGAMATHVKPSAVTGTFDAHFTNGHVVGAFGAHMVEEKE